MGKPESKPHAKVTRLSEVEESEVQWLWLNRVPIGKLTLYSGNPGLGKSFVTLYMAACVTTGRPWPDHPGEKQPIGKVILIGCEDDLSDTVVPRLKAAGCDLSQVIALQSVQSTGDGGEIIERGFNLSTDLAILEAELTANPGVRLIVVDPVSAYCGRVDAHRDAEVRAMLAPLAELAARFSVAVVLVTHMAKAKGGNALTKSMGSIAFVAACRSQWAFVKDHDDPARRLILLGKLNIAKESAGLAYRLVDGKVEWDSDPVTLTADEYFAADVEKPERRKPPTEEDRAIELLREVLEDGPLDAAVVLTDATQRGISEGAIKRARKSIGVESRRAGKGWRFYPPGGESPQEVTHIPVSEPLAS